MQIKEKDLFHGAALAQIVEHGEFKALNKADGKYGHYVVNTDRRLLFKHRTKNRSPWQFTFKPDDLKTNASDRKAGFKTGVVLVCGQNTVCLLSLAQVRKLIDLDASSQQWIRVKIPRSRASMRVNGTSGTLAYTVAHSSFPSRVFKLI